MPVWHALTEEARRNGDLVLLGVIQEQHPDRCRLFAQWQQFNWTILHDPINRLKARSVPIFVAIDEAGVVVDANLTTDEYQAFLDREPAAHLGDNQLANKPARPKPNFPATPDRPEVANADSSDSAEAWEILADHCVLWGQSQELNAAISAYQKAIEHSPNHASAHFSLGVAYRMRFDSSHAVAGDFQAAVDAWGAALEIEPNHYIYRRRIQQYGPRLTKPYPFYDWVEGAQRDVRERGQTPVQLNVLPSGAEIAQPSRTFAQSTQQSKEPDAAGRIARDTKQLIDASVVVVPGKIAPGDAARVHIQLRPTQTAHWNNEVEPLKLWVNVPEGWQVEQQLLDAPQASAAESRETRHLEFEVRSPAELAPQLAESRSAESQSLSAYALFYMCEEVEGQCQYLRKDLRIPIDLGQGK